MENATKLLIYLIVGVLIYQLVFSSGTSIKVNDAFSIKVQIEKLLNIIIDNSETTNNNNSFNQTIQPTPTN